MNDNWPLKATLYHWRVFYTWFSAQRSNNKSFVCTIEYKLLEKPYFLVVSTIFVQFLETIV